MKVLILSAVPTHPQNSGDRSRVWHLAQSLQKLGHETHFAHLSFWRGNQRQMRQYWRERFHLIPYPFPPPWVRLWKKIQREGSTKGKDLALRFFSLRLQNDVLFGAQKLPPPHQIDDWYRPAINSHLDRLLKREHFDSVFVEYVFFSKALERFRPSVLKVIDTIDVFAHRNPLYLQKGVSSQWFSTTPEEEKKGLTRAHTLLAIQKGEAEYFSKLTGRRTAVVGHLFEPPPRRENGKRDKTILFVGADHPANVQGVDFFIRCIFPRIRARIPETSFHLTGGIGRRMGKGITRLRGVVRWGERENLEEIYQKAACVVNPVSVGTGICIKTVEALAHSKPVVTFPAGARGLEEGMGKAFRLADSAESFAESVVELLFDKKSREFLSKQAHEYAQGYYNQNLRALKNALE